MSLPQELEMGYHQRALVDSCFEEGQYEAAISVLEQLRSPIYRPSHAHLCQLIYISLQPIPVATDEKQKLLESPTKIVQQRPSYAPSADAISAARRLLMSLVTTNSPQALGEALPHYSQAPIPHVATSLIGKQALCITRAKNCWDLISEGFITRTSQVYSSPKKRRETLHEELSSGDEMPVGENAWPIFEWLLCLFERDEQLTESCGLLHHSPLLIDQIPPPRAGSTIRWDTSSPLRIVFFCLEQSELRRRVMGARLLTLLINLGNARHLDLQLFVGSVQSRLSTSGDEVWSSILSNLIPSPSVHRFKVSLFQKIINESITKGTDTLPRTARPRPRAQPKSALALDANNSKTEESKAINSNSISTQTHMPSTLGFDEFNHVLTSDISQVSDTTRSLLLRLKFELFMSYGYLQRIDNTSEWTTVHSNGRIESLLENAFGNVDGGDAYIKILRTIVI
ncbi:hypothetical protein BDQ17DRAFT_1346323 [Cyathus striatus]|nr:hypothetical protein BDQ17DRAFT_1346323 [Cyathus striatus]